MQRVKLTIEFEGTDFSGWQRQPQGIRTVQGVIESALDKLPGQHGAVLGAGRTDAGVHALGMVAHVDTSWSATDARFRAALNAHLPQDVVVLRAERCAADFQAQFDCRYRRYLYRLRSLRDNGEQGAVLQRSRVLHVQQSLDVEAMQHAAASLRGRHDFSSFATQETRSRERTVHLCELRPERGELRLHIAADGFLRNMVRCIVGTLVWVGVGRLAAADMMRVVGARDRGAAGPNVAPHGLYFVEAGYEAWDEARSDAYVRTQMV